MGRADDKTLSMTTSWKRKCARIVRQTSQNEIGKKPEVTVVISRLG